MQPRPSAAGWSRLLALVFGPLLGCLVEEPSAPTGRLPPDAPPMRAGQGRLGELPRMADPLPAVTAAPALRPATPREGTVVIEGTLSWQPLPHDLGLVVAWTVEGVELREVARTTLRASGPWRLSVPQGLGEVQVQGMLQSSSAAPTLADPHSALRTLVVGAEPILGVDLALGRSPG